MKPVTDARMSWRRRPEGGSWLVLHLGCRFALVAGRRVTRLVLYPVTLYFMLRRGPERRASRDYLSRVLGRRASLAQVFRHVHAFSSTILDRAYLLSRAFTGFRIRCFGLRELDGALEQGRGVLLFGSHLGSFDALRVLSLERPEVPIRVLIDLELNPMMSTVLNELNPDMAATIINTRQAGPTIALAMKEALDRNAIVALLADRALPGNAVVHARFLGGIASFPSAPWLLAAACKAPVLLSFGLYRGGNRYDLHFETFAGRLEIDRCNRAAELAALVQRFADRLAHYAALAPYNWFNFYDFWQGDAADGRERSDGAVPAAGSDFARRS